MTAIKIWLSDHRWPERVFIGIDREQADTGFRAGAAGGTLNTLSDDRMTQTATIQPVNSIVFVHGGGDYDIPVDKLERNGSLVAASSNCLIVCVYPEIDGSTHMTLGRSADVDPGSAPSFVGELETPQKTLFIDQVDEAVVFTQAVSSTLTTIRIWFSHPRWPEKVVIGID